METPRKGYQNFTKQAHKLYEQYLGHCLPNIPQEIKHLTIIPDGAIGYLPFEILLTKEGNSSILDYSSLPYLIKDYEISYAYSASVLFQGHHRDRHLPNQQLIAFAPSYPQTITDSIQQRSLGKFRNQLTPLVWNTKEAKALSQYFTSNTLIDKAATEQNFKRVSGNYQVIHMAMHALIDAKNPMYSRLAFTQSEDSVEDGYLNAYELYNMELNADLAVLSACNTGYGKLIKGEGIMSLARAFSFAGCPSVIMSHWSVDDQSTSKLMQGFYQNLSNGQSKPEALRNAQLNYLEQAKQHNAHPYYWGAFVLIGDDKPLSQASNWWVYILGIMAGVAVVTALRKKKK